MLADKWLVIFAGGKGTRINSSIVCPKPLVMVDNDPIVWKVLSLYKRVGVKKFIICLGFGSLAIKEFFFRRLGIEFSEVPSGDIELVDPVTLDHYFLLETGEEAQTGWRLSAALPLITSDDFFLTYADGVTDVDIQKLYNFHIGNGSKVTLLSINPLIQYGVLEINEFGHVTRFVEKPPAPYWINAGFFVINKNLISSYLSSISDKKMYLSFEVDVLPKLVTLGLVGAYRHDGFWMSVDTQKDLQILREKWSYLNLP